MQIVSAFLYFWVSCFFFFLGMVLMSNVKRMKWRWPQEKEQEKGRDSRLYDTRYVVDSFLTIIAS